MRAMLRTSRIRPLLPLLLAIGSVAMAVPASANAAVNWIVQGRGFGHGVGMSAYGAYGYAKHGKGYRFILAHYYRGTTIGTLPSERTVRVLLDTSAGDVSFKGASAACGAALQPQITYAAHRVGRT